MTVAYDDLKISAVSLGVEGTVRGRLDQDAAHNRHGVRLDVAARWIQQALQGYVSSMTYCKTLLMRARK